MKVGKLVNRGKVTPELDSSKEVYAGVTFTISRDTVPAQLKMCLV